MIEKESKGGRERKRDFTQGEEMNQIEIIVQERIKKKQRDDTEKDGQRQGEREKEIKR